MKQQSEDEISWENMKYWKCNPFRHYIYMNYEISSGRKVTEEWEREIIIIKGTNLYSYSTEHYQIKKQLKL